MSDVKDIKDYVARKGSCTPGEPELVLERDGMSVYKVPVVELMDRERASHHEAGT